MNHLIQFRMLPAPEGMSHEDKMARYERVLKSVKIRAALRHYAKTGERKSPEDFDVKLSSPPPLIQFGMFIRNGRVYRDALISPHSILPTDAASFAELGHKRKKAMDYAARWAKGSTPPKISTGGIDADTGKIYATEGHHRVMAAKHLNKMVPAQISYRLGKTSEALSEERKAARKLLGLSSPSPLIQLGSISIGTAKKVLRDIRATRPYVKTIRPSVNPHSEIGAVWINDGSREALDRSAAGMGIKPGVLQRKTVVIPRPDIDKDPIGSSLHEHGHAAGSGSIARRNAALEMKDYSWFSGMANPESRYWKSAIKEEYSANKRIKKLVQKHGTEAEVSAWVKTSQDQIKNGYRKPIWDRLRTRIAMARDPSKYAPRRTISDGKEALRQYPHLRRQHLSSPSPLIQLGIKKASPEAVMRIRKALDANSATKGFNLWSDTLMGKHMAGVRAVEKDGVPHLIVYRGTGDGGRESMIRSSGKWSHFERGVTSTSTSKPIAKSFMLRGRINRQPSLGTYLIPEHELGKITTHIGEQEVRHPEIGKFLVRVRSEGQRLSANTPLIQFGRIKDAAIRAGSKVIGAYEAVDPFGIPSRGMAKFFTGAAKEDRSLLSRTSKHREMFTASELGYTEAEYAALQRENFRKSYSIGRPDIQRNLNEAKAYRDAAKKHLIRDASIVGGAGAIGAGAYLALRKPKDRQLSSPSPLIQFSQAGVVELGMLGHSAPLPYQSRLKAALADFKKGGGVRRRNFAREAGESSYNPTTHVIDTHQDPMPPKGDFFRRSYDKRQVNAEKRSFIAWHELGHAKDRAAMQDGMARINAPGDTERVARKEITRRERIANSNASKMIAGGEWRGSGNPAVAAYRKQMIPFTKGYRDQARAHRQVTQLSSPSPLIQLASAAWQRKEGKSESGGLNRKGVASYRRENPGSKLKTAVTTEPSKLKPGSKPAKRRKSFCARMSGMQGPMKKPNGEPTRKALSLRKWNCSSNLPLVQLGIGSAIRNNPKTAIAAGVAAGGAVAAHAISKNAELKKHAWQDREQQANRRSPEDITAALRKRLNTPSAYVSGSEALGIALPGSSDVDIHIPIKSRAKFDRLQAKLGKSFEPMPFNKPGRDHVGYTGKIDGEPVDIAVTYGTKGFEKRAAIRRVAAELTPEKKAQIIAEKRRLKKAWIAPELRYHAYKRGLDVQHGIPLMFPKPLPQEMGSRVRSIQLGIASRLAIAGTAGAGLGVTAALARSPGRPLGEDEDPSGKLLWRRSSIPLIRHYGVGVSGGQVAHVQAGRARGDALFRTESIDKFKAGRPTYVQAERKASKKVLSQIKEKVKTHNLNPGEFDFIKNNCEIAANGALKLKSPTSQAKDAVIASGIGAGVGAAAALAVPKLARIIKNVSKLSSRQGLIKFDDTYDAASGAVGAVGAYSGGRLLYRAAPMVLGKKRLYHGTSKENAEKIKQEGFKASKGGQHGSSAKVKSDSFVKESTGKIHASTSKRIAAAFAHLNGLDISASDKKKQVEMVKGILKRTQGKGAIITSYIPHDSFVNDFQPDPDMALPGKHQVAYRTTKDIAKENIGQRALFRGVSIKDIANYAKRNPKRFLAGAGLAGLGAAGVVSGGALMVRGKRESLLASKATTISFDEQLQPHQLRVIRRITDPRTSGLVVAHGTGTGKTRTAIESHKALGGGADVVLPAALRANYAKEQARWEGPESNIISQQALSLKGSEALSRPLVIVDEAHRARNPRSKLSDALRGGPAQKRLLLTATPSFNNPSDLASLVNTAAGMQHLPEGKAFQKRYLNPGPIDRWRGKRLSNESELKKKLNEYVDYHKGGGDGADMPSVTSRTIPVTMSRRQSDLYRAGMGKLPKGVKVNSDNIDRLKAYFTGPRQVSNSSNAFEPGSNEEPKLDRAYADLTQHLKNPKGKALIYSNWLDHGIKPIQRRLDADKTPYGIFTGKESPKVRDQHIRDYNENRTRALLVSSSGAEGLDLKGTRMVQVLEPHFNNSKIRQVVGRSARMGSHSALGPEDRNVEVRQYIARPRNRFLPGSSKGVEDMLAESSRKKDEVDRQIARLLSSKMKPIQLRSRHNLIQLAMKEDVLRHLAGTRWANDPTGTHQEIVNAATSRARNETYTTPDGKRYVGQGQNMRAAKTTDMLDSTTYAKAKDYQEKVLGNQDTAIKIATAEGKEKRDLQQNVRKSYKPPVNRDGTPATINREKEIIHTRNQLTRGLIQQRSILQSARRQQGIPEPKPLKDFVPFKDNAAPFPEYSERPPMDKGPARAASPIEAEARKAAEARRKAAEDATQKLLIKTNAALDDTSRGSVMQTEQANIRARYRRAISNLQKRVSSKLAEQARIAGRPIKNPDGVAWGYVKPLAANVKVLRPGEKGMPAIEVPQNPAERYGDLADITGDTPERIEKLHKGLERARKAPDDMVRRRVIRSGRIFRNVAEAAKPIPLPTKFPLLKGIGIGAGILGAGYLGAKLLDRKNNQKQLMSSRAKLIRFAWKSGEKVNALVERLLLKDAARKMAKAIKPNSVLALPEPLPNRLYGPARYRQIKHIDPSMTEDAAEAMRGLRIHRVADAPTGRQSIVRTTYPGDQRAAAKSANQLRDEAERDARAAADSRSVEGVKRREEAAAASERQRSGSDVHESQYQKMTRDRIRKEEGQRIGKVTGVKIADIRAEARAEVRAANKSNQNQMKEAKAAYDSGLDEINQKIAKIKRNRLKTTAAAVGSGAAIGGGLGWVARKPDEGIQFSEKEGYTLKQKAAIGAGGLVAAGGLSLLPAALAIGRIPGRGLAAKAIASIGKVKGLRGAFRAPRKDMNSGGKMVADYLDAAQSALNSGVHGKLAGVALRRAVENPKGIIAKMIGDKGDGFASSHYARFRSGPKEAMSHWDYEHGLTLKNRGAGRPAEWLKSRQDKMHFNREAAQAEINDQLWNRGKSESEAIRHVATKSQNPKVQAYFNELASHKREAANKYAKIALLSPAAIIAGGGIAAAGAKGGDRKKREFSSLVRFAEKKPLHPSIVAGLSAGTTGALIAGIPSALRVGSKVGPTLKIAGKVGGTLGGLAAGSVLIGNAISGDPRKGERAAYTKRAAIGGGIGGTIGGTVAGLLAMKTPKGRAWMAKHAKEWRPVAWANRVGPAGAAVVGGIGAGGYGVYQGIDEGSGVDALHGGKTKRMSSRLIPIQFAAPIRQQDQPPNSAIFDAGILVPTALVGQKIFREGRDKITGRTTLYHGTSTAGAEKIKKEGLRPSKSTGVTGISDAILSGKTLDTTKNSTFLTRDRGLFTPGGARSYAGQAEYLSRNPGVDVSGDEGGMKRSAGTIRHAYDGGKVIKYKVPLWKKDIAARIIDNPEHAPFNPLAEYVLQKRTNVFSGDAPDQYRVGSNSYKKYSLGEFKEYAKGNKGKIAKGAGLALLGGGLIAGGVYNAIGGIKERSKWSDRMKMSSKARSIRFAADEIFVNQGFTGKLAQDRYRKKIKEEDLDRRDANVLRSTLAGAGLGAALRGTMPAKYRALIGAGAGAATAIGTRLATRQTADPYGERSREAKTIEGLPYKLAGAAAIGVAGKRGYDKLKATKIAAGKLARGVAGAGIAGLGLYGASQLFSSRRPVIQFEDWDRYYDAPKLKKEYRPQVKKRDWTTKWIGGTSKSGKPIEVNTSRRVADLRRTYSRATGLVGDVKGVLTGEKSVDARGRPKKREWEKPWVQNAAAGLVLGGLGIASVGVRRAAQSGVMRDIADRISDGRLVGRLAKDYPRIGNVVKGVMGIKPRLENEAAGLAKKGEGLAHGLLRYIDEGKVKPVPKLNEVSKQDQEELIARIAKLNKDINTSAREQPNSIIRFDEYEKDPTAAGRFTLRDPRGRSVRVYAGDKGPHYRTPQRELDKKKYLKLKYAALLGSGLVAGTAFGAFGGNPLKNKIAKAVIGEIPAMA